MVFTGGTNANTITGTGSTKIDGEVTSTVSIGSTGGITIVSATTADPTKKGKLTIGATNVGGNVTNDGDLVLQAGTLSKTVNGSGKTEITGAVNNSGYIIQTGGVTVSAGSLTTNAGNVTGAITNNAANGLVFTGGTNANTVTGTGSTKIDGTVTSTAAIGSTGGITIVSATTADPTVAGKLTIDADKIGSDVSNGGELELTGGTDIDTTVTGTSNVTGTGKIVVNGFVTQTGTLASSSGDADAISVSTGKGLVINASNLDAKTTNAGTLKLTGGQLDNAVAGTGSTVIAGNVTNASTITQSTGGITVSSGSLTTNAGDVTGAITNNAANGLIFTGGTNANTITGTGSTKIDGEVTSSASIGSTGGITIVSATTADPTKKGKLTIGATNVGGNVTNDGDLVLQAGTLSKTVTGTGATDIQGAVVNSGSITQSTGGITVTSGSLTTNAGDVTGPITNNVANGLVFTGGTNANAVTGTGSVRINSTGTVTNTATVSEAVNVNAGEFKNTTGGSVTGMLTIDNGASATIDAGTLYDVTNNGTFNYQGGNIIGAYTQTASTAELNVNNGATFTLMGSSSISNGTVTLGTATPASVGTIIIINGTANSAKVTTKGASGLSVIGGSSLTTLAGTNIANDAVVTLGDGSTTGTLNVNTGSVALNSGDTWSANGTVNISGGTLELAGVTQNGTLNQTAGTLNITGDQSLGANASVTGSKVTVAANKTLTLNTGSTVTLDGDDGIGGLTNVVWNGDIVLGGGSLTLSNITDKERSASPSDPSTYNKTGKLTANTGNLTIDSSNVLLGNNDTIADAVNLALSADVTVATGAEMHVTGSEWTTGKITLSGGTLGLNGITTTGVAKALIANTGNLAFTGSSSTLGSDSDTIAKAVTVNVGSDLTINNANATGVVIDGTDTWTNKVITLTNGNLKFDTLTKSTDANLKYIQTGGKLVLDGASLTLNAGSSITGGTVEIDPSNLVFDNGVANSATILMPIDDGSSVTIQGIDSSNTTTLTLLTGTDINYGTVTVGDGTNANVLNVANDSDIAQAVSMVIKDKAIVNLSGATAQLVMNTGDTWTGTLNQTTGTLTALDNLAKTGVLNSTGGTLNVGNADASQDVLNVNNASDVISSATLLNIATDGTLNQTAGTVTIDSADSWNGNVSLGGTGTLTIDGRSDTISGAKTYNQSGGELNLDNGSTLDVAVSTPTSAITGGDVNIKNGSKLTLENGAVNTAKVVMSDGTASTLEVKGANTQYITSTGTNLATGTVTVGDGTTTSKLNVSNNGQIASAVTLNLNTGSEMNIDGATADVTVNTGDTWSGTINQSAGTLTVFDDIAKTGVINSTGGALNIGGTTAGTLNVNNAADVVSKATTVTINTNGVLNQTNGVATLDNTDTWSGAVVLGGGALTLDGRTDTTDATQTYNQTAGTLNLVNADSLTLNTAASAITGGNVNLTGASGITVNNGLTTNSAQLVTTDATANTITVGGTNNSKLQLTGSSEVGKAAVLTVNAGSTLEVNGTTATGIALNGGAVGADTWAGDVQVTGGVLNISDNLTKTGTLTQTSGTGTTNIVDTFAIETGDSITAGTLNVGDGTTATTVNVTGGTVTSGAANAKVNIKANSTMNITGGTVTLDGDDGASGLTQVDWAGTVALNGGTLILDNIIDKTRATDPTDPATYNKTGTLTANTGNLTINATSVLLGDADTIADAVNLTLNSDLYIGKAGTETASAYIGTDDTISGNIHLLNSGALTLDGITTTTKYVDAQGGTLNLVNTGTSGHGSATGITFGNASDKVLYAVATTLNSDLTINAGQVQLDDANDTLTSGAITLGGGELDLKGISTVNNKLTANTGTLKIEGSGKTTELNNAAGDTIAAPVTVTIDAGATLKENNANANVTLDAGDNWNGGVDLAAGTLTIDGRSDTISGAKTYNQSGGELNLDNGSTLDVAVSTPTSAITGGDVNIKNGSKLTLENGAVNTAKVVMSDGTASTLEVKGANTQYITSTGTNLATGTVTVGDGTTTSKLNVSNNGQIASAVTLNLNTGSEMNIDGATADVTVNTGDTWSGTINQSAGTLTVFDDIAKTGVINSTGGALNIGGTTAGTLNVNNAADVVSKATTVTINTNGVLNQTNGVATLDNTDTWSGAVVLGGGALTLDGRTDTTDATQTYNQTAGTATLDASTLTLTPASGITGGNVNLNNASNLTFDNAMTNNQAVVVSDATANALTVGGANGATLTLASGSDVKATTAVTVTPNGILNSIGTSINGAITNDGIFNLENDGATPGTIAGAINNAAGDGTTGIVNLTGNTLSTSAGTINQANVTVGGGATTPSSFTMGANVNVNNMLTVAGDGVIRNTSKDITTKQIAVASGGSITGIGATQGNITINNGGTNAGIINQNNVTLTAGTLNNTGSLTSTGTFTNAAGSTVANGFAEGKGTLNVKNGTNAGIITQGKVTVAAGNTGFNNTSDLNVETTLTNNGTLNNSGNINVTNSSNNASLVNKSTINSSANSNIIADKLTNTGGIMNLNKSKLAVVYQTGDIKGVINVLGSDPSTDKTDISVTGTKPDITGTLNVGNATNKATLNLQSGNVTDAAVVSVAQGNVLNIDDSASTGIASVVLDTNDVVKGDVTLASGNVTMKNLNVVAGATPTTAGGITPYYAQTGGTLNLQNTSLTMEDASRISGGNLFIDATSALNSVSNGFTVDNLINGGLVNAANNSYETYNINNGLYVGDGTSSNQANYTIDLYARNNINKAYDSFGSAGTTIYATNGTDGVINISDITIKGDLMGYDAPTEQAINLDIFNGTVADGQNITFTSVDKEYETPLGWYRLMSKGGGKYTFALSRYNPAAYRGQISTVAQLQNQLLVNDIIFDHTMVDQGFKGNDYIASSPNRYASASDLYAPYQYSRKDGGLWVKGYGTFEKLKMNEGLEVGNNAYGTIIGADFGLKDLRHGWQFMPTAYIAYNGAHQYWNGQGSYQNGGQIGFLGTWYKSNFMLGTLAYGGVYGNTMSTQRGSENTFNYFAGAATKAAYNWRFKENWSLQPNLLVSYNYFGQQNWHADFGQMSMMSGMLNGVNIAPGLNLIWERDTFSTYLTVQYMFNINAKSGGDAGNMQLPDVNMEGGYIQYGLGINKKFTDKFSGYAQVVARNVNRTGVGFQLGFNWKLGKEPASTPSRTTTPSRPIEDDNSIIVPEHNRPDVSLSSTKKKQEKIKKKPESKTEQELIPVPKIEPEIVLPTAPSTYTSNPGYSGGRQLRKLNY